MPRDFIKVNTGDTNAVHAKELVSLIVQLRSTIDQLEKVKDIMDHSNDGSVFTDIETRFGLPATTGQLVYDYVNGTRLAVTGNGQNSNALSLIARVG